MIDKNDYEARLMVILIQHLENNNIDLETIEALGVEREYDEAQKRLKELSELLGVNKSDAGFAALEKFSNVDAFHDNPSDEMMLEQSRKQIQVAYKFIANLAFDLKNEIEKVEK